MDWNLIIKILSDSLYFTAPILLVTLGGLFAYKANVVNIGLEGMMLFGGMFAALALLSSGSWFWAIVATLGGGLLIGLLFAFFGVSRKANFIITGFAINLLAIAVGRYVQALMKVTAISVVGILPRSIVKLDLGFIGDIPFIGPIINNHSLITYVSFALIFIASFILYKTKLGTYIRVVGESEEAAKSIGIKINLIKYIAVIIGALLSGVAGYEVAVNQLSSYTPDITAGTGFIAIAAIYCGNGKPKTAGLYAILFGLARALSINLALRVGNIARLLEIIPYIMIVVVLATVAIIRHRKTLYRGFINE